MPNIGVTIKAIEEAGLRDSVKIMIGGAPVTQAFADEVALTPTLRMPVPPPFVPSSSSRLKQRFRAGISPGPVFTTQVRRSNMNMKTWAADIIAADRKKAPCPSFRSLRCRTWASRSPS